MKGPKAPRDPSTGRRDWEYNEPINRHSFDDSDDDDDDDDDWGYNEDNDNWEDPYADNPHDEPIY